MSKALKAFAEAILLLVAGTSACAGYVIGVVFTAFDKDIMHSWSRECQDVLLAVGCCVIFIAALAAREKLLGRTILRQV